MANALELAIRIVGKDAGAKAALEAVAGVAQKTGAELQSASQNAIQLARSVSGIKANGLKDADSAAGGLKNNLHQSAEASDALRGKLEGMRNAGAGIAAAGGGALILANHLRNVSNEGERATAKLDAMLKKRGEGGRFAEMAQFAEKLAFDMALPDDDPINEAAAGLAGFGMRADEIKRILPGLIGQSRLYGNSLESVAEAAGKAFGKGDLDALTRIGVTLGDEDKARMESVKDSPLAERQKVALEILQKSFKDFALSATEGMSEAEIATARAALQMDKLQSAIGKGAANSQQSIDGIIAKLLQLANASPKVAEGAGAALQWGGYAAGAIGSIVSIGAQVGLLRLAFPKLALTALPSLASVGAAAAAAAIPLALIGITLAALYVAFKGTQDAGTMSAESLRAKWGPLAEIWIRGGEALEGIAATLMGINNQKQGDAAEKATYELYKKGEEKKGRIAKSFEAWRGGAGIGEGTETMPSVAGTPSATASFGNGASGGAGAPASMPDFNAIAAQAATLAGQTAPATTPTGAPVATSDTTSTATPGVDYTARIRAVEDQISATKDKTAKATLQAQLKQLRRAQQDSKRAEGEAKKRDKEITEQQETGEMIRAAELDNRNSTAVAAMQAAAEIAAAREDAATEKEIERIEALKESGRMERKAADAAIKRLRDASERRIKLTEAQNEYKIKQIEAEEVLQKAQIEAENQSDSQRERALNLAKLAADKILGVAKIRLNAAQELVRIAQQSDAGKSLAGVARKAQTAIGGRRIEIGAGSGRSDISTVDAAAMASKSRFSVAQRLSADLMSEATGLRGDEQAERIRQANAMLRDTDADRGFEGYGEPARNRPGMMAGLAQPRGVGQIVPTLNALLNRPVAPREEVEEAPRTREPKSTYRVKNRRETLSNGNVRFTFDPIEVPMPSYTGRF